MCLLPPKSETPSMPGVVIHKTPGTGTTESMFPTASALTPGTILYRGDYDSSRDVLRVETGRVRDVHGTVVVVEDATGVESVDTRYIFGWHASEHAAVAALKTRLQERMAKAEAYRARFALGIGRCSAMLGGK